MPSLPTVSGTSAGGTVTVNNVSGTALGTVNASALVQAGNSNVLVTRTGENAFTAVTAICTHEQCVITGIQSGTFVCPCHGSQYSTTGAVRQGPATRSLQAFTTQFTNNVLTITT